MTPISQYASARQLSEEDVMEMIRDGNLHGEEIGGIWHVDPSKKEELRSAESDKIDLGGGVFPFISKILYILAALSLGGGTMLTVVFYPGTADYGYSWKAAAYIPSITCFAAGIIQAVLFFAFGNIVTLLSEISGNVKKLATSRN